MPDSNGVESPGRSPTSESRNRTEPSQEALDFLQSICDDDFKNLTFDDALVTFSDRGKEVGEFKVSVTEVKFKDEPCFLIDATSQGTIDDIPCGTSVKAFVNRRLETLEQHHHEYLKLSNHPIDRKTVLTKQDDECVIEMCVQQGEETTTSSKKYSSEAMKGVIAEGSNLLLLRLLARRGTRADELTFVSFDSEVNLCQTSYKTLHSEKQSVAGQDVEVTCTERTLFTSQDDLMTWRFFLRNDGHLVKRLQVGSPVVMVIVALPNTMDKDESENKPVFSKKRLNWEEDMEMISKFEDRKEELIADHASYMKEHPDLRNLVSDYIQFLLQRKPTDVLAFTAEYFEAFGPEKPATRASRSSETPDRHPDVKSNRNIEYLSKVSYSK